MSIRWIPFALLLSACGSTWNAQDIDGDGMTAAQGDCWDRVGGPDDSELGGADIHPGADDQAYDGVDADCAKNDDYDADLDGFVPSEHEGKKTAGLGGSGDLPGGDCWDDPGDRPAAMESLNDFDTLPAADVNPAAQDTWYDGVDQDCDGLNDFDQDGDGFDSAYFENAEGILGDDCFDSLEDDFDNGEKLDPAAVFPGASDAWYAGTDQNCDGNEYDQDEDGFLYDEECDDENPNVYPNDLPDAWYDCEDTNCDGNDGDKDEDGFLPEDYTQSCADWETLNPGHFGGDCWDDPDGAIPPEMVKIRFVQPEAYQVNPGATEVYYDAVDQNCDGLDDFDSDEDGEATKWYADRESDLGPDCYDDPSDQTEFAVDPGGFEPADINTDATENYYDGVDQNCDSESDYDQDHDGYDVDSFGGDDCEDDDVNVNPGEDEDCFTAAIDEDCDGTTNDPDAENCAPYYQDTDGDGWGDQAHMECQCEPTVAHPVAGPVSDFDCDDNDVDDYPGATETVGNEDDESCDGSETCYRNQDGDGYRLTTTLSSTDIDCDDSGEATAGVPTLDCDDANADDYPGASETVGNGDDESCDGSETCYANADGDGYRLNSTVVSADTDCNDAGEALSTLATLDCDDADANDYPSAPETVGNGDDESCDGNESCYDDDDNDGYLDTSGDTRTSSDTDCADANEGQNTDPTTDCDDASASDNPGAVETVGNGDDEDCNGQEICYDDDDNDGYLDTAGDTRTSTTDTDCADANEGTNTDPTTDCDDASSSDYPGATETIGNGDDESCDGNETCYDDDDNDGYLDASGDTRTSTADTDCADAYEGTNTDPTTDCDDSSASDYPGAAETVGNGDDESCDGTETCYDDDDNDGYLDTSGDTRTSTTDTDCADANEGTNTDPTTDCDDASASDYPGAAETIGNGDDDNCDGNETCYDDDDDDGWLDTSGDTRASGDSDCSDAFEGTNTDATTDCDDFSAGDNPGAVETVGNGDDDNCDGSETCYDDDDNDGYLDTSGDTRVSSTDTDCSDAYEGTNGDLTTDCDDFSSSDYPGASETIGNGDDENCDGAESCYYDTDNDGYRLDTYFSGDGDCNDAGEALSTEPNGDCADSDSTRNPGQVDDDSPLGVDNDCDDYIDEAAVTYGDVIMTELMIHVTGGTANEWFEIYNASGHTLYLDGWEFSQGSDAFCVSPDVPSLPSGGYLVFCAEAGVPGVTCDYDYNVNAYAAWAGGGCSVEDPDIDLDDTDTLTLDLDGATIDAMSWNPTDWPFSNDTSKMLHTSFLDADLNDTLANWCDGQTTYTPSNYGTPGDASDCP